MIFSNKTSLVSYLLQYLDTMALMIGKMLLLAKLSLTAPTGYNGDVEN